MHILPSLPIYPKPITKNLSLALSHQKLDVILVNKVILKLKLSKNVVLNWYEKNKKDWDIFWYRKLTLNVKFSISQRLIKKEIKLVWYVVHTNATTLICASQRAGLRITLKQENTNREQNLLKFVNPVSFSSS